MSQKREAFPDAPKNRYYPRLDAEILFAYRPAGAPEDESTVVKSRSIGLGGLMFEADHPLPVGSSFHLDLVLGEDHLEVTAKVVYSNKMVKHSYQNGLNFVDLRDEQRDQLTNYFLQEYDRTPPDGP